MSTNFPSSLDSYTDKVDNTDDVLAAHLNNPQDAIEALEAKVGVDNSAVITSLDYLLKSASSEDPGHVHSLSDGASDVTVSYTRINDFFDSAVTTAYSTMDAFYTNFYTTGRKIYFYSNTVPTGWTIVAVTDAVLAVKGGSQAYNVTGGQTGGSWAQPDHILIDAEMPIHTHLMGSQDSDAGTSSTPSMEFVRSYGDGNGPSATSSQSGGDQAHSHGTTYRPMAAVGVIGEKD